MHTKLLLANSSRYVVEKPLDKGLARVTEPSEVPQIRHPIAAFRPKSLSLSTPLEIPHCSGRKSPTVFLSRLTVSAGWREEDSGRGAAEVDSAGHQPSRNNQLRLILPMRTRECSAASPPIQEQCRKWGSTWLKRTRWLWSGWPTRSTAMIFQELNSASSWHATCLSIGRAT